MRIWPLQYVISSKSSDLSSARTHSGYRLTPSPCPYPLVPLINSLLWLPVWPDARAFVVVSFWCRYSLRSDPYRQISPPHTHSKHTLISCNYTLLEQLSIRPRWETNTNETCLLMFCFPFFARNQWRSFSFQAYDGRPLLVMCSTSKKIQLPETNMALQT